MLDLQAYGEKTEIAPVTGDAAAAVRSSTEAAAPAKNAAAYTPPSWSGTPDGYRQSLSNWRMHSLMQAVQ